MCARVINNSTARTPFKSSEAFSTLMRREGGGGLFSSPFQSLDFEAAYNSCPLFVYGSFSIVPHFPPFLSSNRHQPHHCQTFVLLHYFSLFTERFSHTEFKVLEENCRGLRNGYTEHDITHVILTQFLWQNN